MSDRPLSPGRTSLRTIFLIAAFVILMVYVYLYLFAPFTEPLNNNILTIISAAASLPAALFAALVFLEYHPLDQPRKMWQGVTIAIWMWFASEIIWAFIYLAFEESPGASLADLGWFLGYPVFSIAIYHQLVLLQPARRALIRNIILAVWAALLVIPLVAVLIVGDFHFGNYVSYFYPLADIALGVAGLWFVRLFRGSMLTRPWLGMIFFSFSDVFYAASVQTGVYDWSASNKMILSLFVDTNYIFAYLLIALGFLENWSLIRFGLRRPE